MKLKKFKERDNKRIGIILFTIVCILLVSGVILYRTFAIFEVKTNQNVINGQVQGMGDLEFAFYKDDEIVQEVPKKEEGYSLDTSSSYCIDLLNDKQVSTVNWDNERWGPYLSNITTTKTKCYLYFKQIYKETILNGAIPDLGNGRLVPVTISETEGPTFYVGESKGGKVTKADITNTSNPWYKYADKKWANAVILKDGVVDNYSPGQEIEEKDIEAYFVWIPRYSYTPQDKEETFDSYASAEDKGPQENIQSFYSSISGNKGDSNAFEIEFGSRDKEISTALLSTSIVHPAFETFDSNGFWVGKFETGYNQNSDESVMPTDSWKVDDAQQNTEASTKVIIKPSVYSWRYINVSNAFYTSYNYQRDLESHMMKNVEWGAVAYLTQSIYGRCEGNQNCSDVRINNVDTYITGSAAKDKPTCGYTGTNESCNQNETVNGLYIDGKYSNNYYNQASKVASTTGNYSGIYDLSGGSYEIVMGVMQSGEENSTPASGRSNTNNSGFNGIFTCPNCDNNDGTISFKIDGKSWPSSKYYDLYDYDTTIQNYQRGHLGDATKEFGPFYSVDWPKTAGDTYTNIVGSYNADVADLVADKAPWVRRGGSRNDGTNAGLFAFSNTYGSPQKNQSFRIVLTP